MVKWAGQEARTTAKRDSGNDCSWAKEELAFIVRTKKQLQEPVEIEVSEPPSSNFRTSSGLNRTWTICWKSKQQCV